MWFSSLALAGQFLVSGTAPERHCGMLEQLVVLSEDDFVARHQVDRALECPFLREGSEQDRTVIAFAHVRERVEVEDDVALLGRFARVTRRLQDGGQLDRMIGVELEEAVFDRIEHVSGLQAESETTRRIARELARRTPIDLSGSSDETTALIRDWAWLSWCTASETAVMDALQPMVDRRDPHAIRQWGRANPTYASYLPWRNAEHMCRWRTPEMTAEWLERRVALEMSWTRLATGPRGIAGLSPKRQSRIARGNR